MEKCTGDRYNICCPRCGRNNRNVSDGIKVKIGKISFFKKVCSNCGKLVYYQVKYEETIVAFSENPMPEFIMAN